MTNEHTLTELRAIRDTLQQLTAHITHTPPTLDRVPWFDGHGDQPTQTDDEQHGGDWHLVRAQTPAAGQ